MSKVNNINIVSSQCLQNTIFFAGLIFSRGFTDFHTTLTAVYGYVLLCILSPLVAFVVLPVARETGDNKTSSRFTHYRKVLYLIIVISSISLYFVHDMVSGILAVFLAGIVFSHDVYMKDMVIMDVLGTGAEFSLKAALGAAMTNKSISPWLIVCSFLLALLVSLGQRRNEITNGNNKETLRKVLSMYSPQLLDQMIAVVTSSTILGYSLYTISTYPKKIVHSTILVYTIPFVLYGVMRYLYLVYTKNMTKRIELELIIDKPLLINFAIWIGAIIFIMIIYGHS